MRSPAYARGEKSERAREGEKMNSFKWDFKPKKIVGELNAEKLEELLFDYLASLYQNGQICRDFELIKKDGSGGYAAYAILPEDDAFDEKYADEAVRKSSKKIGACFDVSVSCLGENMDYDDVCRCEKPSAYVLYTMGRRESPVMCLRCGDSVPLYKIPISNDSDRTEDCKRYRVLWWQETHRATDTLWLNSLSDRFTSRQLSDPASQLSRLGLEICEGIEKKTGVQTFYYLHYDGIFGKKFSKVCPKCGGAWKKIESERFDYVCENCRLAANDPDNTVWSKEKGEKDSRERKRNEELIARALENEEREQKAREE